MEVVSSPSSRAVITGSNRVRLQEEKSVAVQDPFGGLPAELYHFYHGSQVDMGALIEVCCTLDHVITASPGLNVHILWKLLFMSLFVKGTMCKSRKFLCRFCGPSEI